MFVDLAADIHIFRKTGGPVFCLEAGEEFPEEACDRLWGILFPSEADGDMENGVVLMFMWFLGLGGRYRFQVGVSNFGGTG